MTPNERIIEAQIHILNMRDQMKSLKDLMDKHRKKRFKRKTKRSTGKLLIRFLKKMGEPIDENRKINLINAECAKYENQCV